MASKAVSGGSNVGYYIKVLITFILMFGFGFLPTVEPLTDMGMKVLGIFFGALFGWCFIGIIWPSIMGMMALVLLNIKTVGEVMSSGWGSTTTMLIFFMMIIAAITEQSGVSKFLSVYFISRKWVIGKPWLFVFVFMCTTFCLSAMTSTVPTIVLSWSIFYGICTQVGYKKYEAFPTFMVIGIVVVATFGLALFPFRPVGILVFGVLKELSGIEVNYGTYTAFTLIMGILNTLVFVALGKFVFRIDVSLLRAVNEDSFKNADMSLNKTQKAVMMFMAVLIVVLLLPSFLPKDLFLYTILKRVDSVGAAAILVAIMCFLKVDGEPIINFKKVASKGMQWDVLFLTATVMPLSAAIGSADSGITALLVKVFSPILAGKGVFLFLTMAIIISVICTQFCVNNVVGAMLLPVFYPFAVQLGLDPLAVTALLAYSCHFALLTPSASPMAALMHGNSEWCRSADIYKYGTLIVIASTVVCCVVGIPLCQIIL